MLFRQGVKRFNRVTANLIRIIAKLYQNQPRFVKNTTKTF